jgi:hypothetical protein
MVYTISGDILLGSYPIYLIEVANTEHEPVWDTKN